VKTVTTKNTKNTKAHEEKKMRRRMFSPHNLVKRDPVVLDPNVKPDYFALGFKARVDGVVARSGNPYGTRRVPATLWDDGYLAAETEGAGD